MKLTSLALTFSLTVIVGLIAVGGRSEAHYRAQPRVAVQEAAPQQRSTEAATAATAAEPL